MKRVKPEPPSAGAAAVCPLPATLTAPVSPAAAVAGEPAAAGCAHAGSVAATHGAAGRSCADAAIGTAPHVSTIKKHRVNLLILRVPSGFVHVDHTAVLSPPLPSAT